MNNRINWKLRAGSNRRDFLISTSYADFIKGTATVVLTYCLGMDLPQSLFNEKGFESLLQSNWKICILCVSYQPPSVSRTVKIPLVQISINNPFNLEKWNKLCLIFTFITLVSMLTVVTSALLRGLKDGKVIRKKVYLCGC